jgi:hypothetical protein
LPPALPDPTCWTSTSTAEPGTDTPPSASCATPGCWTERRPTVRTPSGGLHAYFTGSDQRNGHLPGCHLDFRSRGGYVLTPPSQIGGKPYQLVKTPNNRGGLDWDAVIQLLQPDREPQRPRHRQADGREISSLARWVASQGEGNRNAGLFWAANRALDADPAADLSPLAAAARQAGLGDKEIARTLESARKGGRTRMNVPDYQPEAGGQA